MRSESCEAKSLVISAHAAAKRGQARVPRARWQRGGKHRRSRPTGRRGCRSRRSCPPSRPAARRVRPSPRAAAPSCAWRAWICPLPGPPHSSRKNETSWNLRTCVRVGVGCVGVRGRVGAWVFKPQTARLEGVHVALEHQLDVAPRDVDAAREEAHQERAVVAKGREVGRDERLPVRLPDVGRADGASGLSGSTMRPRCCCARRAAWRSRPPP